MKLILTNHPYRLEQGNELGFGANGSKPMAEVILAFREEQQDILFSYTNWDAELDPHRDEQIENALELFHEDLIHDPEEKIAQQVKEILLGHYAPDRNPAVNGPLMDQLLAHYKQVPLDELNEELTRKIGTAIHRLNTVYTLEDRDPVSQAFINERLVFTSNSWLMRYDRPVYLKNTLWYRANTVEEIAESFEHSDWWFTCAIVNAGTPVEEYNYLLDYTEEHGDEGEHDGMVLYITTRTPDHFREVVLPRLQQLLGDSLEVMG